jgi:hypothetical protein
MLFICIKILLLLPLQVNIGAGAPAITNVHRQQSAWKPNADLIWFQAEVLEDPVPFS